MAVCLVYIATVNHDEAYTIGKHLLHEVHILTIIGIDGTILQEVEPGISVWHAPSLLSECISDRKDRVENAAILILNTVTIVEMIMPLLLAHVS